MNSNTLIRESINHYCAKIGSDSMLVQGAGGNVSWKDGDTLWVKASGTWLADSKTDDIFVSVDLAKLLAAVEIGNFAATPTLTCTSDLRPSIETMLHALMPHTVVVHLHPVEVMPFLVTQNCLDYLRSHIGGSLSWIVVDYFRPGWELAEAVSIALTDKPIPDVVFLRNHGIIIGGPNVGHIDKMLRSLIKKLGQTREFVRQLTVPMNLNTVIQAAYVLVDDIEVQQLVFEPTLIQHLTHNWALYPDHVVFLGPSPSIFLSINDFSDYINNATDKPILVFILGVGVFATNSFTITMRTQLRCYYDIVSRLTKDASVVQLFENKVNELINLESEKYRLINSK
jgi:rhamnose utilization protein RhaD (predicted bifunctional aldolase and dehydrogenase)